MKRLIVGGIGLLALFAIGMYSTASADALDQGTPLLAMMGGGGGGMMGGGMMGGGQGYGGMGSYGFSQGFNGDRDDYHQGYGNNPYRNDSSDRQELKDELHRQRQELSDMIHSGKADPDAIDRKMEQIDRLENRLDTSRR